VEPDICRGSNYYEIRLRFECDEIDLKYVKDTFVSNLLEFTERTHITMREDEPLGSHEGEHGHRHKKYRGIESENFGEDWPTMVEIMQRGAESALEILHLGTQLKGSKALGWDRRPSPPEHPYFLHLSANQLLVEL
jgi:hypothetical protein